MKDSMMKKDKSELGFTTLYNDLFHCGLSAEAVGVLVYMLHLPDDWVYRKSHLMKVFNMGRDKMDRIFKELKNVGYISEARRIRGESGKFEGVDYTVHLKPKNIHTTEKPHTAYHTTGKPQADNQCTGKQHLLNTNSTNILTVLNTNIPSTNFTKSSAEYLKHQLGYDPEHDDLDFLK